MPPATEVRTKDVIINASWLTRLKVLPAIPVIAAAKSKGRKDQFQACTSGFSYPSNSNSGGNMRKIISDQYTMKPMSMSQTTSF